MNDPPQIVHRSTTDDKYTQVAKFAKSIDLSECHFTEEIANLIERDR